MKTTGDPKGLIKSVRHLVNNEELQLSAGRVSFNLGYPESMIRIRYDSERREFVIGKGNEDGEFTEVIRIPGEYP